MNFTTWLESEETHPVIKLSLIAGKYGWKYEPPSIEMETNPAAFSDGDVYPTLVSPQGIKIALDASDRYKYNNHVRIGSSWDVKPDRVTVAAVLSPGELRGQGAATAAMKQLQEMAKSLGMRLVGEPVQMKKFKDKKSLSTKQLVAWYKRLGWVSRVEGDDSVLEYRPNS